jgi:hypothetical protein
MECEGHILARNLHSAEGEGGELPLLTWNTGSENKWEIYFITQVQFVSSTDSFLSIWDKTLRKEREVEMQFNSDAQPSG